MKTKKFNLNWQSVLLGVVLCLVLVVLVGSNANAQTTQTTTQTRIIQNSVTMNEVWEKTNALEVKINAMTERLINIKTCTDETYKEVLRLKKAIEKIGNK